MVGNCLDFKVIPLSTMMSARRSFSKKDPKSTQSQAFKDVFNTYVYQMSV